MIHDCPDCAPGIRCQKCDERVRATVQSLFAMQAGKLRAVADWFTDCKTLTLENMPHGLMAALRAGADALEIIGRQRCSDAIAVAVAQRVAELPNRTSPDDWPDAMLVTGEELQFIVTDEINKA